MSNEVYANGNEVSCKAAAGKSIAAMPDVCFTPPLTPATPPGVPIPYPNTGMASDTSSGSKTVQISGDEVMKKDSSFFKTSTGDEAGNAPKKNVITSVIQGKCYYTAWSMDVKIEGENAVRHLDMMTHNHASGPGATPPWPYLDAQAITPDHPCHESVKKEKEACNPPPEGKGATPTPNMVPRRDRNGVPTGEMRQSGVICTEACAEARRCVLPKKSDDKRVCCHPNTTGDHLVEVNSFTQTGTRGGWLKGSRAAAAIGGWSYTPDGPPINPSSSRPIAGFENYDEEEAPTACANPDGTTGKHAQMQAARDRVKRQCRNRERNVPIDIFPTGETSFWTYGEAAAAGAKSHKLANPKCNEECTKQQLDNYHHPVIPGDTPAEKNAAPVRTYIPPS
jgi:hypothetical protein